VLTPRTIEEAVVRFKPDGATDGFVRRIPEAYILDAATKSFEAVKARTLGEERARRLGRRCETPMLRSEFERPWFSEAITSSKHMPRTRTPGITVDVNSRRTINKEYRGERIFVRVGSIAQEDDRTTSGRRD
jgi:hypothetical protein